MQTYNPWQNKNKLGEPCAHLAFCLEEFPDYREEKENPSRDQLASVSWRDREAALAVDRGAKEIILSHCSRQSPGEKQEIHRKSSRNMYTGLV